MKPMHTVPNKEGLKITATLKRNEPRLFDDTTEVRMVVGVDRLGRYVLHVGKSEVAVKPNTFEGWVIGWTIEPEVTV